MSGVVGRTIGISWIYVAVYAGVGLYTPFLPVWLRSRGLTDAQIGLALAAPLLCRVATSPAAALWADGFRLRRTPIALMALAAAASLLALIAQSAWVAIALVWFLAATLFGVLTPLVDVVILRAAADRDLAFAWVRSAGSAAYIAANLAGGFGLVATGPDLVPIGSAVCALAAAAVACRGLPPIAVRDPAAPHIGGAGVAGLMGLARNRRFLLAIVSAGLIQGSHAYYYGFSALLWRTKGLPSAEVGGLWAVAVIAEVAFLLFGEGLRRHVRTERLLVLGGAGAVVRWACMAASPPVWCLAPLQTLHALSFTATFIASVQLVQRLCPAATASSGQSLNSALSSGLFIGLATIAAGAIASKVGAGGYLVMALIALPGLLGAVILDRLSLKAPRRPLAIQPQSAVVGGSTRDPA